MIDDFSFIPSYKEYFEEINDFEKTSYLSHINYIDTITEFENRFNDFKKIKGEVQILLSHLVFLLRM